MWLALLGRNMILWAQERVPLECENWRDAKQMLRLQKPSTLTCCHGNDVASCSSDYTREIDSARRFEFTGQWNGKKWHKNWKRNTKYKQQPIQKKRMFQIPHGTASICLSLSTFNQPQFVQINTRTISRKPALFLLLHWTIQFEPVYYRNRQCQLK